MAHFRDRHHAGQILADALSIYAREGPIVLALPRGGVPVAFEIARALDAPLDVWIVRKIGMPWHPELGVGAVSETGYVHLRNTVLAEVGLSAETLQQVIDQQRAEVAARVRKYRGNRPRPELKNRTVILVDDGIATGGSVRAAIASIRAEGPREIVLAVPVAAASTAVELAGEADRVVSLLTPDDFYAVGFWYEDFRQTTDREVLELLDREREAPEFRGTP